VTVVVRGNLLQLDITDIIPEESLNDGEISVVNSHSRKPEMLLRCRVAAERRARG